MINKGDKTQLKRFYGQITDAVCKLLFNNDLNISKDIGDKLNNSFLNMITLAKKFNFDMPKR